MVVVKYGQIFGGKRAGYIRTKASVTVSKMYKLTVNAVRVVAGENREVDPVEILQHFSYSLTLVGIWEKFKG